MPLNDPADPQKGLCVGDNEGPAPEPDEDLGSSESDAVTGPPRAGDTGSTVGPDGGSTDAATGAPTPTGSESNPGENDACNGGGASHSPWPWAFSLMLLVAVRRRFMAPTPTP